MSVHAEIVRDYVSLRNFLARSNPKPNMPFEVEFVIEGNVLLARNNITQSKTQLATFLPGLQIFIPIENQFLSYTNDMIAFTNNRLTFGSFDKTEIILWVVEHRASLGLSALYEP